MLTFLRGVGYNSFMRNVSKEELKEFLKADKNILEVVKNLDEGNFKELWVNEREYKKHMLKRLKKGHIKNKKDYIKKIKDTFLNPDDVKWKKYKSDFKQKSKRFDRFYYKKGDWWVDIFLENNKIVTAYKLEKDYFEILLKGNRDTFEIINIPIEELKNGRKN